MFEFKRRDCSSRPPALLGHEVRVDLECSRVDLAAGVTLLGGLNTCFSSELGVLSHETVIDGGSISRCYWFVHLKGVTLLRMDVERTLVISVDM